MGVFLKTALTMLVDTDPRLRRERCVVLGSTKSTDVWVVIQLVGGFFLGACHRLSTSIQFFQV